MNNAKRCTLAMTLLAGAFFVSACADAPTATRRPLPSAAHANHLGARPSALWEYECKGNGACTFDASASHPGSSGAAIVDYAWGWDGAVRIQGANAVVQAQLAKGSRRVVFTVTDANGARDFLELTVRVPGRVRLEATPNGGGNAILVAMVSILGVWYADRRSVDDVIRESRREGSVTPQ